MTTATLKILRFTIECRANQRKIKQENGKSKRILPEFSSPAFRLNSFFFSFDDVEENLMMLKKDFAIFSLPFSPFSREMIMMIEEMDLGKVMEE